MMQNIDALSHKIHFTQCMIMKIFCKSQHLGLFSQECDSSSIRVAFLSDLRGAITNKNWKKVDIVSLRRIRVQSYSHFFSEMF